MGRSMRRSEVAVAMPVRAEPLDGGAMSLVDPSAVGSPPRRRHMRRVVAGEVVAPPSPEMTSVSEPHDPDPAALTPRRRRAVRALFSPHYKGSEGTEGMRVSRRASTSGPISYLRDSHTTTRRPLFGPGGTPPVVSGGIDLTTNEDASDLLEEIGMPSTPIAAAVERTAQAAENIDEATEGLLFVLQLPPFEHLSVPQVVLPCKTRSSPPITLVLDLDETLVHCNTLPMENPDGVFNVTFNGAQLTVYMRLRPFLSEFLQRMSALFEVVVFTASQRIYADTLLNIIDRDRRFIKHRLFRDSCAVVDGAYLKDLRVLGRDLSRTLIVDNSIEAFGYHLGNGVPIMSWYEDRTDSELRGLADFLESLHGVNDVRPVLRDRFGLHDSLERLRRGGGHHHHHQHHRLQHLHHHPTHTHHGMHHHDHGGMQS